MMRFLTWAVGNRSVKVGVSLILPDKARYCGSDQPMIDSIVVRIHGTAQIITIAHENVKRFRYDIVPVFDRVPNVGVSVVSPNARRTAIA